MYTMYYVTIGVHNPNKTKTTNQPRPNQPYLTHTYPNLIILPINENEGPLRLRVESAEPYRPEKR